jgi:hypothetical protein
MSAVLTTHDDPGWWLAVRSVWRYLIPTVRILVRGATNGLTALRSLFLGFVADLLLFLVVLSFIEPWDGGDEGWVPWAVVAYGVTTLAWVATIRRRPLPMASQLSPESLAASYRTTFFLQLALAEAAAIGGLAGAFVGGSLWIYVVGRPWVSSGCG